MAARRQNKTSDGANSEPVRRCIVSGETLPQQILIRFVVGPDDTIVPDLDERLPGRGFWLSADPDMIHTACAKQLFNRVARKKVEVSLTLAADIEKLLSRKCLDRVALARRAGQAIAGFEKASIWLRHSGNIPALLFEATDGAVGGKEKMRRLAAKAAIVDVFSAEELGGAMGNERTVHLVIAQGGLAEGIARDVRRLAKFRAARTTEE